MEQEKTVADINLTKVDIDKYRFILKAGSTLYRVIIGKYDPRIPTGQENRYAKNPNKLSIEYFQEEFWEGRSVICGTGDICCSAQLVTSFKEVLKKEVKPEIAVAHKLTLVKDISAINTISLCLAENVDPTPKDNDEFWHSFYGPPIRAQALRCRSAQDSDGENIIIFPDNIPDYLSSISSEELSQDETESIIKKIEENKLKFI